MPLWRIPAMSGLVMGRASSRSAVCGKWRSGAPSSRPLRTIAWSRESVFFNRSARIGAIALGTVQKRRRHSLEAASGAPLLGPLLP